VQKYRVQNDTRCRIETKRNIGNAKNRETTGQLFLDPTDSFDGLERVAAIFLDAG
jgi:hypothetical protein